MLAEYGSTFDVVWLAGGGVVEVTSRLVVRYPGIALDAPCTDWEGLPWQSYQTSDQETVRQMFGCIGLGCKQTLFERALVSYSSVYAAPRALGEC